jgi:hypothetical protein
MFPGCSLVGNENALEKCSIDVEMLEGSDTPWAGGWIRQCGYFAGGSSLETRVDHVDPSADGRCQT